MNLIEALPTIGSFLLGPAGGIAGAGIEWLAEKFGASEKTVEGIKQTLSGMTAEQLLAAKKIDIEFQMFCLDNAIKVDMAQIAVNAEEAKSNSVLVAGWRPAVGWICAAALAYAAILEPVFRFIAAVAFGYKGAFPVIDTMLTMQVLFGMLGFGAMRSFDKKNGVAK
jgi:hypothetical protein